MVDYKLIELHPARYIITKAEGFVGSDDRYVRTIKNLNKMLRDGRSLAIIVPERSLSADELEEYRAFFCQEAKRVRRNLVYFEGPINIEEVELCQ